MFRPGSPAVAGWSVAAGVVVIAPWLDGSPRWPAWFGGLALALALALGLGSRRPELWTRRLDGPTRLLVVFAALLLGLALLQTLPLGAALGWLSPATLEARSPFLLEGQPGRLWGPTCLSLEPHLTRIGAMAWAGAAVIAALAARAGEPRWLCAALLAGGALQAAVALSQTGDLPRARGTFVSPNNLAALLALLLPVALALAGVGQRVPPRGWRRGLPLAAGGTLLLGLVASRSRSGALAAVVAVGLYLVLVGVTRGRRAGWVAALALLILGVAGADLTLDRFERLLAGEETDRLTLWAVGWQLFVRFPLLGAGLRSHSALTPELLAEPRLLDATHNDYLNLLADCGLVGGALALGAAAAWVSCVRRRLRELPAGGARSTLLAACAAAAAGMAVSSVVEFGLQVAPILWTFAALAGIAAGGDPHAPARPGAPRRAWTRALGWALGLAALGLAFHGARLALSRAALDGASDPRAPMTTRLEGLARAARLWPEHARVDVEWGRALLEHGDRAGAAQVAARACRKAPRDPWAHLTLARALAPGEARERLTAARRLAPHDPAVRLEAGRQGLVLAASSGASRDDRALALADLRAAVVSWDPALPDVIAVLLAQPAPAVTDFEAFLPPTRPDLRRRCVAELAPHSPGPARLLLEPLLVPGGDAHDLARAASLDARLGRHELARDGWLEAARTHPAPGDLLRGAARDLAGRPDLLEGLLKDAAAARPDEPEVWRELGRFLLARRRAGEARVALERAVELDPHAGWRELGDAHAAEGRRESARLAWKRALTAAAGPGERADLHLRVARSLAAQGDAAAALDEARAALGCDPEHEGARALVDQLRRR